MGLIEENGPFPGPKEIRRRLACSFLTASRALGILRAEGWIQERGRRLIRQPPVATGGESHVYIAGSRQIPGGMGGHLSTFVSSVRRELDKLHWGEPRFFLSDQPLSDPLAPGEHTVSALIFMRYRVDKGWGIYLKRKSRIPLVYINMEESRGGDYSAHQQYFRLLPTNKDAGLQVARHLWSLGHRSIAYFTHVSTHVAWNVNRLRGLGEVFKEAIEGPSGLVVYNSSLSGTPENGAGASFRDVNQLRRKLESLSVLASQELAVRIGPLSDLVSLVNTGGQLKLYFESALSDRKITAWVCANDDIACLALEFLRSRGVPVPGRISVAGFDNSPAAGRSNLTSYDFGLDNMGTIAATCLSRPQLIRADAFRSLPVRGYLVCRASTAKASSSWLSRG